MEGCGDPLKCPARVLATFYLIVEILKAMESILSIVMTRPVGDKLVKAGKWDEAKALYWSNAKRLVGDQFQIPGISGSSGDGGLRSAQYTNMGHFERADLMGCCNGMAKCCIHEKDIESALAWLDEVNVLYLNGYYSAEQGPLYDWFDHNIDLPEITFQRVTALTTGAALLHDLGNTATAAQRRWNSRDTIKGMPQSHFTPEVNAMNDMNKVTDAISLRHPVPRLCAKLEVTASSLQIRGSWKKLQLPNYPIPSSKTGLFVGWNMVVHEEQKRAYLFTGRPRLDYFDLVTETWESIITTYKVRRPISQPGHGGTKIGCNLFMELDLSTNEWRRLSGYVMPPAKGDYSRPGPRVSPSSWAEKGRFWLLMGQCDREGARLTGELHGAHIGFPYSDMWSWDIDGEKWRRERVVGNPPSSRAEMACTYNPNLKNVITFGGYCANIPTIYPAQKGRFDYSYYADTFIHETPDSSSISLAKPSSSFSTTAGTSDRPIPSSEIPQPKWRQVLTQGFPTYRCQAQLHTDTATGRTYLFGGFTNTDYVPSRGSRLNTRSFGDVWQLRLDVPGGDFEGVDLDEEARTAKAGPWQRCFTCGDAGMWKKCSGTHKCKKNVK
ncbi:hypothetical protein K443DRAFT_130487 [Laccaria amethystina LaAM-08-1]|uniref:Uncharacterized protein n=1 Tax=Laccaria amethystina LaAM-08-1 TaxID=1095629 RepID=A0A0C9XUL9_9AGAR|nr:hypothetical protein K443DRAFT_130487 [Laccaria amethystina LaAM-08-1]